MKSYPRPAHPAGVELVISDDNGQIGIVTLTREQIYLHLEAFVRGFRSLDIQGQMQSDRGMGRDWSSLPSDTGRVEPGGDGLPDGPADGRSRRCCGKGIAAVALALMLLCGSVQAGDIGEWFKSLRQPDTGMSCCDLSDCRALKDDEWRLVDGDYEVILHGRWEKVPEDKVLHRRDNPKQAPVLCAMTKIFCFVPYGELS